MASWLIVFLFTIGAVLLFAVGMSLTLMMKGHHIDSEIATNKHMQERGITCAVHDAHGEKDGDCDDIICDDRSCVTCSTTKER